jgi:hypothetical protein
MERFKSYPMLFLLVFVSVLLAHTAYAIQFLVEVTGTGRETYRVEETHNSSNSPIGFGMATFPSDECTQASCTTREEIFGHEFDPQGNVVTEYKLTVSIEHGNNSTATLALINTQNNTSQSISCNTMSSFNCQASLNVTVNRNIIYLWKVTVSLGQNATPVKAIGSATYTTSTTQMQQLSGTCSPVVIYQVTASESPTVIGTLSEVCKMTDLPFTPKHGGTIDQERYSVSGKALRSSDAPFLSVVFSDTKTPTTTMKTADLLASDLSGPIACGDTATLIQALAFSGVGTITLNSQNQGDCTYTLTKAFDSAAQDGLPPVARRLTINGSGSIIERSNTPGTPDFRIFDIKHGGNLTLNNLTVRNGWVSGDGGGIANSGTVQLINSTVRENHASSSGGGISNSFSSALFELAHMTIFNSTISDNGAGKGGGIVNEGSMDVINSTIAYNDAANGGGVFTFHALLNFRRPSITLANSTVSGNTVADSISAGGIFNEHERVIADAKVELVNTIVAAQSLGKDCSGSITSLGHNLDSDGTCGLDPGKGDLPKTAPGFDLFLDPGTPGMGRFSLLNDSPAIDKGTNDGCPPTDQLGHPRPVDGKGFHTNGVTTCDIGAIEFYPNVNIALDFDLIAPPQTVKDMTGCPSGFQGKFNFTARLRGEARDVPPLTNLFVQVSTLSHGNLLLTERGPGGVGATVTVPRKDQYADGTLQGTDFVDVPFTICLQALTPFDFFVDVFGNVLPIP